MRGRYNAYTPGRAARVCGLIGQGKSLMAIGRMADMPSFTTLVRWRARYPEIEAAFVAANAARGRFRGPRGPYGSLAQIAARRAAREAARRAPGRPTSYSLEIAEEVCARVADGESLLEMSHDPGLPSPQSLHSWMKQHAEFDAMYQAACEVRAELIADEVVAIADDDSEDLFEQGDGKPPAANIQAIRRAGLMMRSRMWRVKTLAPRRFGPRPEVPTGPREMTWEEALDELD